MHVHLIDGTFELFRAFFGSPAATHGGAEVGAARGLIRSFAAWLRSGEITHVAIAFDHVIESFRNELFAGYKTGEGMDPALHSQFGIAEDVARALGMVVWPMIDFEADDALATAAAFLHGAVDVDKIVIASPDKDLTQCVRGERVVTFDRIRKTYLDEDGVVAKFGISPASIPDYLALVGDTADGVPGLPRWGARSAATVLAHYKHLEAIPDSSNDWPFSVRGAPALASVLAERRQDALLYRTLTTLRTDVPLETAPTALHWRGVDSQALDALCDRLGTDVSAAKLGLPVAPV